MILLTPSSAISTITASLSPDTSARLAAATGHVAARSGASPWAVDAAGISGPHPPPASPPAALLAVAGWPRQQPRSRRLLSPPPGTSWEPAGSSYHPREVGR